MEVTPLWRTAIKPLLTAKDSYDVATRDILASARCFDLSAVDELLSSTSKELLKAAHFIDEDICEVDIGGRVVFPNALSWIECHTVGLLLNSNSSHDVTLGGERAGVFIWANGYQEGEIIGDIRLHESEAALVTVFAGRQSERQRRLERIFLSLAALAIINSPAARREPVPAHVGLERKLRAAGHQVPREITHTKVTIGGGCGEGESRISVSSHPKAYHFCRAHPRVRLGKTERVRAHWRGDPAFGIRLPSYEVRSPRS